MKKAAILALLAVLSSGCATQTYLLGSTNAPNNTATAEFDKTQNFLLAGIGQEQTVDAAQVCSGQRNVHSVQTQESAMNVLLSTITFGIYTPRQLRVFCK